MNFALSEEQQMLQSMAKEFVNRESSMKRIRALREDAQGFSPAVWEKMAGLGWLGINLPERLGGQEMGQVEMAVIMEELGRGLMPEPVLSTVMLGGNLLLLAGSEAQQADWLAPMAEGRVQLALAHEERQSRYNVFDVSTAAHQDGSGWVLNGEKVYVENAHAAQRILVTARTSGQRRDREGLDVFLLDPAAKGLTREAAPSMDWRRRSHLRLENVRVDEADRLSGGQPMDLALEATLDRATVGLCAEMLGAMSQAFEMTVDYLKARKQFGVPIGSFQALKHRCADEYVQNELARSSVYYAAMCLDEGMDDAQAAVSTAKARCNNAFHLIANESVQMHGGIGMTDEHDIGFYFKRARVSEVTLGDTTHHRDRYARLREY